MALTVSSSSTKEDFFDFFSCIHDDIALLTFTIQQLFLLKKE